MNVELTLGAVERFEDQAGVGLLSLVDGRDITVVKERWTVRRLRLLMECVGKEPAEIRDALSLRKLTETQMQVIIQIVEQLSPSVEAQEHLSEAQEGGESTGNFRSADG